MTTTVYQRRFGNIPKQPRYKRSIECFQHTNAPGYYLPFIDPHKHRFTCYQAHLNSTHLSRVNRQEFTNQRCGKCGIAGHTRTSCWLDNISHGDQECCGLRIQGNGVHNMYDRYLLYHIGKTAKLAAEACWSHHITQGGRIGLEYLWDENDSTGIRTNLRVVVYKTDNQDRICRCTSCYKYFEKCIQQFPLKQQERHRSTNSVDTNELQFMEDEEIREQLRNVEIKTDGNCPICMEEILNVNKVVTKCGHVYCASCLFQNITNSSNCPMCREELVDTKPMYDKIRVLEAEVHIMRQELANRSKLLRRVQAMIRENI